LSVPIKILHIDSNHPLLWEQLQEAGFENHADFSSTKEEVEKKSKIIKESSLEADLKLIKHL